MIRPDGQASWRRKTKPKSRSGAVHLLPPGIRVILLEKNVDADHRVVDDGTLGRCCVWTGDPCSGE